jgi:hypothetical protein
MQFYTYAHYKPEQGGLFYIGKGQGNRAYNTNKRNPHWVRIVNKYGKPDVEVLAYWDTEKEAFDHEKLLIASFRDMGFVLANVTDGGEGCVGLRHTDEVKQRISSLNKGRKLTQEQLEKLRLASTGRKHTQETKDYLKKINLERVLTDEQKSKISEAGKRKKLSAEAKDKIRQKALGRKMSEEHRAIISATHKGKKQSPEQINKRIASRLATIAAKKLNERKV